MVLGRGRPLPGDRVLPALRACARHLPRNRVVDLVHRGHREPHPQLRRPPPRRPPRRSSGRARTGRSSSVTYGELAAETNRLAGALLELGVGRGDAVGLFLPMSIQAVAGFYAVCQDRRDRRPDLLGVRRARRRDPAGRRRRGGAPDRRRGAEARTARVDEGDRRRRCRRRPDRAARRRVGPAGDPSAHDGRPRPSLGRARRPPEPRAPGSGARLRDADDGDLHVRDDGPSQGRRPRPRRIPGEDRRGSGVPGRRPRRRPRHVGDGHGLDHGPVGRHRSGRGRRDARALGGSARLPRPRPAVGARRAAPDLGARRLAHADPRAALARRRPRWPSTTARRSGSSRSTGEPWNPDP